MVVGMKRPPRDRSSPALYQGLAPGRHGLARAEVQRHQRDRLQGAMVAAVARHGYADTTIGELVRLAGVSRTTFYAHFKDKEDCFLATYDSIVEAARERVTQAYLAAGDWGERMRAGFSEFMAVLASDPAAARLVIVDSLALGARAFERRAGAATGFEQMLRTSFDQTPGLGHVPDTTIRAMVGGVRRVIYHQLTEGRPEKLPELVDDLLRWVLSYQTAAPEGIDLERRAPTGPKPSAAPDASHSQLLDLPAARLTLTPRERIVLAVTTVVAERGYQDLTIPRISATAGISNQTFYEHFGGKEEAFLAAFDGGAAGAMGDTLAAFEAAPTWPEALWSGLEALLGFLASEPYFSRLAFLELLAAGPAAYGRSELVLDAFGAFLDPGFELRPEVPRLVGQAIVGGMWSIIHQEVAHERTAALVHLTPRLAYIALAPFVGAAEAAVLAGDDPTGEPAPAGPTGD
jgi:AcrR family transcriptional regulator